MHNRTLKALLILLMGVTPSAALAQGRPAPRPATPAAPAAPAATAGEEIKLDEGGTLKADAVQSRMQALLANLALIQRQFQDLQQEWGKSLEERKKLIEDAGKKAGIDVKDTTEWAFDKQGQRYIHGRPAASAPQTPSR